MDGWTDGWMKGKEKEGKEGKEGRMREEKKGKERRGEEGSGSGCIDRRVVSSLQDRKGMMGCSVLSKIHTHRDIYRWIKSSISSLI